MILEDYCSFEVDKLLKEKGFNTSCMGRYSVRSKEFHLDGTKMCNNGGLFEYAAPTHQMAMKWLREVHHIFIEISTSIDLNGKYHFSYTILDKECKYVKLGCTNFNWKYEDAVEAALEYVLTNLI